MLQCSHDTLLPAGSSVKESFRSGQIIFSFFLCLGDRYTVAEVAIIIG